MVYVSKIDSILNTDQTWLPFSGITVKRTSSSVRRHHAILPSDAREAQNSGANQRESEAERISELHTCKCVHISYLALEPHPLLRPTSETLITFSTGDNSVHTPNQPRVGSPGTFGGFKLAGDLNLGTLILVFDRTEARAKSNY